jgi:hypothetical protein
LLLNFRFTDDSLYFKGVGLPENKQHEVTINFYKKINTEKVASKNSGRCFEFIINKAESSDYWPSLTTDKKKPHWLKVDFNKWKDEGSDDDSEGGMGDMSGMGGGGMPGMGGMGGMPGMGGMGGMGGMPGMGGMGGMGNFNDLMAGMGGFGGGGADGDGRPSFDDLEGEEDSDDEAIPDLEVAADTKK